MTAVFFFLITMKKQKRTNNSPRSSVVVRALWVTWLANQAVFAVDVDVVAMDVSCVTYQCI